MKRLVSPLLLVLFLSSFAIGWRTTPPVPPPPPDALVYPVSMTLAGDRLLVSDSYTGLHVYDVSNLSAPTKLLRIPLRYNVSSAVKDDIIYTNHYEQLQAIRVTDGSYQVVAKIGPDPNYPHVIPNPGRGDSGYACSSCSDNSYAPVPTTAPSAGSSFATFALVDNQLYRVQGLSLVVYDVSNATKPAWVSAVSVNWNIETVFPTPNFLFIGGRQGMYIFDRSDPLHPRQISKIEHTVACDPVVVESSTAFVTLRSLGGCGGTTNELMCVSIKDPSQPVIIGEKALQTPWGLAVKNQQIFLSHGDDGFSLVDVTQPDAPAVKATWTDRPTRDFIWSGNTLFVMGTDNVYIFDVTNPEDPVFLSQVQGIPGT